VTGVASMLTDLADAAQLAPAADHIGGS